MAAIVSMNTQPSEKTSDLKSLLFSLTTSGAQYFLVKPCSHAVLEIAKVVGKPKVGKQDFDPMAVFLVYKNVLRLDVFMPNYLLMHNFYARG